MRDLQVLAAAQLSGSFAEQQNRVGRPLKAARHYAIRVFEETDDTDGGRGVDRLTVGLVVEADVAAGTRHVERAPRNPDPLARSCELLTDARPSPVAEIAAVRRRPR